MLNATQEVGTGMGILRMWSTGAAGQEMGIESRRGAKGLRKYLIKEKKGDRWERKVGFQKRLGRPYLSVLGDSFFFLLLFGDCKDCLWRNRVSESYGKIIVRDEVNLRKERWEGR